jgi:hypothetical protein
MCFKYLGRPGFEGCPFQATLALVKSVGKCAHELMISCLEMEESGKEKWVSATKIQAGVDFPHRTLFTQRCPYHFELSLVVGPKWIWMSR